MFNFSFNYDFKYFAILRKIEEDIATKVNKALNAVTDTLAASAGYAENRNDFGNNLVGNGVANSLGLVVDYLPVGRALGVTGRKALIQGINQGTNYLTDKVKNIFYSNDK